MGSKGRIPTSYQRHPAIGPGMVHSDPYGRPMRSPQHGFFPLDVLPPVEVMEQKIASQHVEMQKLATENQRLASTHGSLRQELGAAQHELQLLHAQIGEMKSESEHQRRGLVDNITRMEAELRASDSIKGALQQARTEAQNLVSSRQDLVLKLQQLTPELQMAHSDVQQIPILLSELAGLRQEYQHCRATYEYEKKAYNDHLESLQVMEKNYIAMTAEVEKLRGQLSNSSNFNRQAGGQYPAYNENEAAGNYSMGQNANAYGYGYGYGTSQGQGHLPVGASSGGTADATAVGAGAGATPTETQPGTVATSAPPPPPPARAAYDASGGHNYDTQRGPPVPGYDVQRAMGGPGYDPQRAAMTPGYEAHRGPVHDGQRVPGYDAQWRLNYDGHSASGPPQYNAQRGSAYEAQRNARYDVSSTAAAANAAAGPQGQVAPLQHNAPYGSTTPPSHVTGAGYEAVQRGGTNMRR